MTTEATMTPERWQRAMEHPEEFKVNDGDGNSYPLLSIGKLREDDCRRVSFRDAFGEADWWLFDANGRAPGTRFYIRPRPKPTPEPDVAALVEAKAEIERLRGLLIDPGSPAWEDGRAILAAELRKADLHNHAELVANGEGVYVPSWIALNLIGQANCTEATIRADERARVLEEIGEALPDEIDCFRILRRAGRNDKDKARLMATAIRPRALKDQQPGASS